MADSSSEEHDLDPAVSQTAARTPVVVLGASAGGLESFTAFLDSLHQSPGAALVFMMHLDPRRPSNLAALLRSHSGLPVVEAEDGTLLEPDCCYVPPHGALVTFQGGRLRCAEAEDDRRRSVDTALRSLGLDFGPAAVCVILSGSGSDGAAGLRTVSQEGGLVIAQDPSSARFPGMPSAAIASGLVDMVLRPEDMPTAIVGYLAREATLETAEAELGGGQIREILTQVKARAGKDFGQYKLPTMRRRILRRMSLLGIASPADYVARLRTDPMEAERLLRDLLIGVTAFFRDPEAFASLRAAVGPLLERSSAEQPLRAWVPGCATGMEAYTIAIMLVEEMEKRSLNRNLQVFATDIDEDALNVARAGAYPSSIEEGLTEDQVRRFFVQQEGGYRVTKSIRDQVIFAAHDVIADPPFSRLDLLSCRNVLIYMNSDLQRRLAGLFHYALNPGGLLFLGSAEGLSNAAHLFEAVDARARIFRRRPGPMNAAFQLPVAPYGGVGTVWSERYSVRPPSKSDALSFAGVGNRILLASHTPPAVLINLEREILSYFGHTGPYLEAPSGAPDLDLLRMVKPALAAPLRAALREATETRQTARVPGLRVGPPDGALVDIVVEPVHDADAAPGMLLVVFEPGHSPRAEASTAPGEEAGARDPVIQALESELQDARLQLKLTVEELEVSNEELKSANEELLSMNEELQSSNEELETSKEELQSVNEELETVNDELSAKVKELESAHSDVENLLRATEIATVFVDRDLRVRSFTPAATQVFRFVESDLGRPLADIRGELPYEALEEGAHEVLEKLAGVAWEATTSAGKAYSVHVFPYRTTEHVIGGVVFTFIDVTEAKAREARLEFLVRELDHRVKNVLTTVQAIVQQTAATMQGDDFVEALTGRLAALGEIHEDLSQQGQGGSTVVRLVQRAVEPYLSSATQVEVTDDDRFLPAAVAMPLFMVLHELASNASKHGSLSRPEGRLLVDITAGDDPTRLVLDWREAGGPPVGPPERRGFGMSLIEHGLEYELGGEAEVEFAGEGLHARLVIPLDRSGLDSSPLGLSV